MRSEVLGARVAIYLAAEKWDLAAAGATHLIRTAAVPSRRDEKRIDYCVMDDLPALIWAANLADLKLHTFLHRAPAITRPTTVAFDLDPGPPVDIVLCCKVGLWLKEMFESLNHKVFQRLQDQKACKSSSPSIPRLPMIGRKNSRGRWLNGWNASTRI